MKARYLLYIIYAMLVSMVNTTLSCSLIGNQPIRLGNDLIDHPQDSYYGRVVYCDDAICSQAVVDQAVASWNEAVGTEVFKYLDQDTQIQPTDIPIYIHDLSEVEAKGQVIGLTHYRHTDDIDSVWIEIDPISVDQVPVLIHELGHALGLGHNLVDYTSIMYPIVFDQEYGDSQSITLDEIELLDIVTKEEK